MVEPRQNFKSLTQKMWVNVEKMWINVEKMWINAEKMWIYVETEGLCNPYILIPIT